MYQDEKIKSPPYFSIVMPTFNHVSTIAESLDSILIQNFTNFEIIVSNDGSDESYEAVKDRYSAEPRVKWHLDQGNLGYCGNLRRAMDKASGKVIFYFASDDVMGVGALSAYFDAFSENPQVKAIARTYFAYEEKPSIPIRAKPVIGNKQFQIISLDSQLKDIKSVFSTLDQLSGLAFYKEEIRILPNDHVFPSHAYPVADIFSRTGVLGYFNKDYLAVRVGESQCRTVSKIYDISPVETWDIFLRTIFMQSHPEIYKYLSKNWIAKNPIGLFQIANFSQKPLYYVLREWVIMCKLNPTNLLSIWMYCSLLMSIFIPKVALIMLIDFIKIKLNKSFIRKIFFVKPEFN